MSEGGVAVAGVRERRVRALGIAVSVLLVAAAIFLATLGSDGEEPSATAPARLVSAPELAARAEALGHPIFWAGRRPPLRLELAEEADGSVYLRYLPATVPAGDPRVDFLTVGTYPVADAAGALRRTAAAAGVALRAGPGGAVVLPNPNAAGSAYLAAPGSDLQVEVYAPAPGAALRLIRSGQIGPVG